MAGPTAGEPFKPALLVVDMQEDFCPPVGVLIMKGFNNVRKS